MKNIINNEIKIENITPDQIGDLAEILTQWQKNPEFMQYLIESPMDKNGNIKFLEKKLAGDLSSLHVAIYKNEIASILSLHSYDVQDGSIEETIRVSPILIGKGIGTTIKNQVFEKKLQISGIQKIISRHSAWNKGTFGTNKNCGGELTDFVEEYVMLSNKGVMTDAFKWEIKKEKRKDEKLLNLVTGKHRDRIINGLQKHFLL